MRRVQRHTTGSVRLDRRRKTWNYLWYDGPTRRSKLIGTKQQYPTKAAAWEAAAAFTSTLEKRREASEVLNLNTLVTHYRQEKMPKRTDTRRSYEVWLRNHILPKWGDCSLTDLQARPVELWLGALALSPKSKAHIRGLLSVIWDYAMWRGDVPTQRNPMELVTVKGATKRTRQPRSLTVEEFQNFALQLEEPFRTMALLCCCLGLRISECLGLKWSDVDWLDGKLLVERGIVCQNVDDVKTSESRKQLVLAGELIAALQRWKQATQFSGVGRLDVCFSSPARETAVVVRSSLARVPESSKSFWHRWTRHSLASAYVPQLARLSRDAGRARYKSS